MESAVAITAKVDRSAEGQTKGRNPDWKYPEVGYTANTYPPDRYGYQDSGAINGGRLQYNGDRATGFPSALRPYTDSPLGGGGGFYNYNSKYPYNNYKPYNDQFFSSNYPKYVQKVYYPIYVHDYKPVPVPYPVGGSGGGLYTNYRPPQNIKVGYGSHLGFVEALVTPNHGVKVEYGLNPFLCYGLGMRSCTGFLYKQPQPLRQFKAA